MSMSRMTGKPRTLDDLIADCQDRVLRGDLREPPPMQSFESGPPPWFFWLIVALAGVAGGAWVIAMICYFAA